jgi:hypothetical protein
MVERASPGHVGAPALAEVLDPAIFRLGELAPDEIGTGERMFKNVR